VDEHKSLIGLLSRHDVLHAVHGAYFEFLIGVIDKKNTTIEVINAQNKGLVGERELFFHFKSLLDAIPDPVFMKDQDLRWIYGNSVILDLYGLSPDNYIGKRDDELLPQEFAKACIKSDEHVRETCRIDISEEYACDPQGEKHSYEVYKAPYLNRETGAFQGLIGIGRDITERKFHEQQLETLANYDSLTKLANRSTLMGHLQSVVARALREDRKAALLLFDLDHFKDVNDSFGHKIGDLLLLSVAERFSSRLREGDFIARLGGDEFAVVLDNLVRVEDAGIIADEMIASLGVEYTLEEGFHVHIGASAGIVIAPTNGKEAVELLQYADAALYRAKSEGRGRFCYYTDALTHAARKRVECEIQLRRAIENEEFEVYYQPQVHIATGRIIGAEALVRWNDPIRGIIVPAFFIPLAEETGLIGKIGEWVLNETCRQGKIWLDNGHRLTLAVNVSPHQIRHQNIPKMVNDALKKSGFNPYLLELELTESALMQREEETLLMLHTLRAYGVRLAIDDFGTGYSSFSYLKRFPIDVLKIDKTFIDDIPIEPNDMAITSAIITMGLALGFQVLAEGTESIEQIEFLREKGCTMYQGYYKSPPRPCGGV
jgi:diguanylate cyclase (GGDEF)-like protein/PAS domain S-box-containing protein